MGSISITTAKHWTAYSHIHFIFCETKKCFSEIFLLETWIRLQSVVNDKWIKDGLQDQYEDLIILEINYYKFLGGDIKSVHYYVLQQSIETVTNDTVVTVGVCVSQLKRNVKESAKSRCCRAHSQ